jgi:hypothetical protein
MMDTIVRNLFSTEAGVVWLVLKWILVVAAAGFVGQFGKAFAAYLIRKAREGKEKDTVPTTRRQAPPPALKAEAVPPVVQGDAGPELPAAQEKPFASQPVTESSARLKDDKKQAKALAKQQKKFLKKLFK